MSTDAYDGAQIATAIRALGDSLAPLYQGVTPRTMDGIVNGGGETLRYDAWARRPRDSGVRFSRERRCAVMHVVAGLTNGRCDAEHPCIAARQPKGLLLVQFEGLVAPAVPYPAFGLRIPTQKYPSLKALVKNEPLMGGKERDMSVGTTEAGDGRRVLRRGSAQDGEAGDHGYVGTASAVPETGIGD